MHKENYENIIKFYRNEGNTLDLISVKLNTINQYVCLLYTSDAADE